MTDAYETQVTGTDVSVGDESPMLVVEDISRVDFAKYAGASGDFNPLHVDESYARDAGNPSIFGHGMFTTGLASHLVATGSAWRTSTGSEFASLTESGPATTSLSRARSPTGKTRMTPSASRSSSPLRISTRKLCSAGTRPRRSLPSRDPPLPLVDDQFAVRDLEPLLDGELVDGDTHHRVESQLEGFSVDLVRIAGDGDRQVVGRSLRP